MNFVNLNVNCHVANPVHTAPWLPKERVKFRVSRLLSERKQINICQKCFLCHSVVLCKTCNKCLKCCLKSACRGQAAKLLANLAVSGCRTESSSNPERGLYLPLSDPAKITRSPTVISCYVNPHRNLYLLEALHQLIDKNALELVQNQTSFQPSIFSLKSPKMETYTRPEQAKSFLKMEKFKMETLEIIRTSLQQGEWVTSIDFKDAYFHIPIHEQSRKYQILCPGSDIPVQSTAFRSVHSSLGVHCSCKGVETDDHTQGYKNPPVPRWLVGEGQIPGLSPAHQRSSEYMPRTRLAGEFRKIRTGAKANLRFCRLPVRPQGRLGLTYTGPFRTKY